MRPTDWDAHWRSTRPTAWFFHVVYKPLLRGVALHKPAILELGAGAGRNSAELLKHYGGHATLIDSNAAARETALAGLDGLPARYILADLWRWRPAQRFDLVHSEGLVEHFHGRRQQQVFNLHGRWLKPGGLALITAPTPCLAYRLLKAWLRLRRRWIYSDEVPLTSDELARRAKAAGFQVLKAIKPPISPQAGILCRKV